MVSKKRSPKVLLKKFSYTYLFFAVLGIIAAALVLFIPGVNDALKPYVSENLNPMVYIETVLIISILGDLWYYWLVGRYVKGKSKGNVYMVLLILGVVGGLVGIFTGSKGTSTMNLALDIAGLYFLLRAKNEDK